MCVSEIQNTQFRMRKCRCCARCCCCCLFVSLKISFISEFNQCVFAKRAFILRLLLFLLLIQSFRAKCTLSCTFFATGCVLLPLLLVLPQSAIQQRFIHKKRIYLLNALTFKIRLTHKVLSCCFVVSSCFMFFSFHSHCAICSYVIITTIHTSVYEYTCNLCEL